jgi:hypothetical protein
VTTWPPEVGTCAMISFEVFCCQILTMVRSPVAVTRPSSIAKGPTAEARFPQLPLQSTVGVVTATWANR